MYLDLDRQMTPPRGSQLSGIRHEPEASAAPYDRRPSLLTAWLGLLGRDMRDLALSQPRTKEILNAYRPNLISVTMPHTMTKAANEVHGL